MTLQAAALPKWVRRLGYYGLALLLVVAAAMLRWALPGVLGPTPFLVFYLAWVGAAVLGGLGPGLFATAASWLCVELFFDSSPGVSIVGSPTEPARLVVALVGGLTVSLLAESLRRGRIREHRQMKRLAEQTGQLRTANEELRESEEKYRALVENSLVGIGISKGERIIYANQSLLRMYGYDDFEEFAAKSLLDHLTPSSRAVLEEWGERYRRGEDVPTVLEHDIVRKDGAIRTLQLSVSFLSGGDGVYAHTAFVDITERKRAEETVAESHKKYRGLVEKINDWVWEIDADGAYTYVSPRAQELLGYTPEEIVGKTPFDFMPPAEAQRVWNVFEPLWLARKPVELFENTLVRKDGRLVIVETSGMPVFAEDGTFLGYTGVDRDITARKQAEEALRESEDRLHLALGAARMGVWQWEVGTQHVVWSPELYALLGYEPGQVTPTHEAFRRRIHPEDLARWEQAVRESLERCEDYSCEFRLIWADGSVHWVEARGQYGYGSSDNAAETLWMRGVLSDIERRKHTEEALAESQKRFERAIEATSDGIWEWEIETGKEFFSPRWCEIIGYSDNDPELPHTFDSWYSRIHPDDSARVQVAIKAHLEEGRPYDVDYRHLHRSGEYRWQNSKGLAIRDQSGKLVLMVGTIRDISERKRAEEALRESEEKFRLLAETSPAAILIYQEGKYVYVNPAAESISGYRYDELVQQEVGDILHPDDRPQIKKLTAQRTQGPTAPIRREVRILTKDGRERWMDQSSVSITYGNKPAGLVVAFDITERKRAEETLRESEERFRSLIEAAPEAIFVQSEGAFLYVNPSALRLFGAEEPAELVRDESLERVAPEYRGAVRDCIRQQRETGRTVPLMEMEFLRLDGSRVPVETTAVPISFQGREAHLVFVRDISERRRAEEALRQSERNYREVFNAVNDAIFVHDADTGAILDINESMLRLYGGSREEALRLTPDEGSLGVSPYSAVEVRQWIDKTIAEGPQVFEWQARKKSGELFWVEVALKYTQINGQPRILAIARDISERKQAETQLRRLNEELEQRVQQRTAELLHRTWQLQKLTLDMSEAEDRERRRMAEILHDDLQQVLAAAKFHLGLMRRQVKQDYALQATVAKIDEMLREAIHKSRSLSHELSPAVLHFGDLGEILRWLADQVQAKHGLVVHVHAHGPVHPQSNAVTALLYKTAQELLFNVVKHARVDQAEVRVRQCGRRVCLSVSDRGRGFDPQELRAATGFGLLNIRERIELLGGRMKITSAIGKGSTVTIIVPDGRETEGRGRKTQDGKKTETGTASSVVRSPSSVVRVLLADDHEVVRQGLALLLSEEHAVEIVGEATNGREAVELTDQLRPDVVIMDVSMPVMGGEEATRRIKEDVPQTRVIALSTYNEPEIIEKMYRAGAEGYVLKTASSEELLVAIRNKDAEPLAAPL